MGLRFTSSQLEFISSEFGLDNKQIETADDKTLDELYDRLCDIEVEETMASGNGELSERGVKTAELVTLMGDDD